jgi:uncharacterized protein (UPF0333 family)
MSDQATSSEILSTNTSPAQSNLTSNKNQVAKTTALLLASVVLVAGVMGGIWVSKQQSGDTSNTSSSTSANTANVVYFQQGQKLHKFDLTTQTSSTVLNKATLYISPDQSTVYYQEKIGNAELGIYKHKLNTDQKTLVFKWQTDDVEGSLFSFGSISPDQKYLVMNRFGGYVGGSRYWLIDMATGKPLKYLYSLPTNEQVWLNNNQLLYSDAPGTCAEINPTGNQLNCENSEDIALSIYDVSNSTNKVIYKQKWKNSRDGQLRFKYLFTNQGSVFFGVSTADTIVETNMQVAHYQYDIAANKLTEVSASDSVYPKLIAKTLQAKPDAKDITISNLNHASGIYGVEIFTRMANGERVYDIATFDLANVDASFKIIIQNAAELL